MRLVFMGSPDFSVPSLQAIDRAYQVVGVVTQPDRPAGRGRALTPPPVKVAALTLGLPVFQPVRLRTADATQVVADWAPDLIIVAAYGQILRQPILELPPNGCLNVHASLLPRWRGASPVQAALRAGDPVTGVTIMKMDAGMDTGTILAQASLPVGDSDTGGSLTARLAPLGASLLLETLTGYLEGSITPAAQDEDLVTLSPLLHKEDGRLDFTLSAAELERQIRAYNPWPGAFLEWEGRRIGVERGRAVRSAQVRVGGLTITAGVPAVSTADGALVLEVVRPAGRQSVSGEAFLRGTPAFASGQVQLRGNAG
jgi:methionyl-tRNA formyltransferase